MMINGILEKNTTKWTTLPAGESRISVEDLLQLDDESLYNAYQEYILFWNKERGWEHQKYAALFSGHDVLEIGSGLGYDAIKMAPLSISWTCADIVEQNIYFVDRVARLCNVNNITTQFMKNVLKHDFGKFFNGFYAHGVLHHIPFDLAKQQVENISRFLEHGTRVALLMYPRERWEHCGKPSFEEFGIITDGPGTPWAEWYDEQKVRELFGSQYELVETIPWGWNNIEFVNFELVKKKS